MQSSDRFIVALQNKEKKTLYGKHSYFWPKQPSNRKFKANQPAGASLSYEGDQGNQHFLSLLVTILSTFIWIVFLDN